MKTVEEEKKEVETLENRVRTKVDDDYIQKLIEAGMDYEPAADMIVYIMTYELREDVENEFKQLYVPDHLFLGDKDEDITKQKMWLLKKGPDVKNTANMNLGDRIIVRGNAFRLNIRLNEDEDGEQELFLFTVRDYDVIGHFTK